MVSSTPPTSCLTVRSHASSRTMSPRHNEAESSTSPEDIQVSHDASSSLAEESPAVEEPRTDDTHKKRGRKGHSKSRTGCFNCKKARIKVLHTSPLISAGRAELYYSARKIDRHVTTAATAVFTANGPRFRSTRSGH
jgi:hypothetical protein